MERTINVRHMCLEINADFERFTERLEQSLGRFDPSLLEDPGNDSRSVEARLKESEGAEGLMLFNIREHGKLLSLAGSPRKAKQYVLGNPLVALTMTRHDIRAGLYAPLRILVYEAGDRSTRCEFDLPSSLFGQFDNPDVIAVARSLDAKLTNLLQMAERLAKGSSVA